MSYSEDESLELEDKSLNQPRTDFLLLGDRMEFDGFEAFVIYSPTESSPGYNDSATDMDRYLAAEEEKTVNMRDMI